MYIWLVLQKLCCGCVERNSIISLTGSCEQDDEASLPVRDGEAY